MLKLEVAKEIGMNACVDKLGRDFVLAHRELAATAYGECDEGMFCFVGVDTKARIHNELILDSRTKFQYYVSCNVDLRDGIPHFVECVVPSKQNT